MAKSPKLKVFRTPIGFHEPYVAAPSQKAALEAWGASVDLFARGAAEIVTDPALAEEPLAHPGEVVKRLRGTEAEQLAALPPDRPRRVNMKAPSKTAPTRSKRLAQAAMPKPKPKPKPSRALLEQAEAALAEARVKHQSEEADLAARRAALDKEDQALRDRHEDERVALERRRDQAEKAYESALRARKG